MSLEDIKDEAKEAVASVAKGRIRRVADSVVKGVASLGNKGGLLDTILGKVISRKLLVFGTATYLLATAGLDSDTWGLIAIVYIGGQSAVDTMKAWRHGR
tara:strand:- start:2385 stop:2684 length:300 start_codon:yes stop_codon:yes gene_type:complete